MKAIRLTLDSPNPNRYQWSLVTNDEALSIEGENFALDNELHVMVRGFLSDPRADNARRVGLEIGSTIGTGALHAALLEYSQRVDTVCLNLSVPSWLSHFPWECLTLSGELEPLAFRVPMLRAYQNDSHLGVFMNQCILVSPHCQGEVRDRTLYSSTRRLSRKDSVEVVELSPPSSTSLRRVIKNGALGIHFEGVESDLVTLDDGVFQLGDLGFKDNAWLVVLGGTAACHEGAKTLSSRGVGQIIWRSFEANPRSQAIFERSFYHALADGDGVATAIFRARNSVAQSDGENIYRALSYVLTVKAPASDLSYAPFPPSHVRKIKDMDLNSALHVDQLRQPLMNLRALPPHPVPLSVFVKESIQVLRGQLESPALQDSRKAALRRLAIRHANQNPQQNLPRDADALRHLLEDLVGVEDHELLAAQGRGESVRELAKHLGLDEAFVIGLVHTVRAHRMLRIQTDDFAQARILVRGLAESVYGYCPRFFAHADKEQFFEGPAISSDGTYYPGGGFSRILSTHWRRDETAALQPDLPRPTTRLPSLGRVNQGWHIFRGSWIVIESCDGWSYDEEERIARAIQCRVFEGVNRMGKPFRLAVPKDFRVIFLSRPKADPSRSVVPVVSVANGQAISDLSERWIAYLAEVFGPPSGVSEVRYRTAFVDRFSDLFDWLRLLCYPSIDRGEQLLGSAYSYGGEVNKALAAALKTLYGEALTAAVIEAEQNASLGPIIQRVLEDAHTVNEIQKYAALSLYARFNAEKLERLSGYKGLSPHETLTSLLRALKPRARRENNVPNSP